MLCQLSYAGRQRLIVASLGALDGQLLDRRANPLDRLRDLSLASRIGFRGVLPQPPLPQAEQQLPARSLVDPLARRRARRAPLSGRRGRRRRPRRRRSWSRKRRWAPTRSARARARPAAAAASGARRTPASTSRSSRSAISSIFGESSWVSVRVAALRRQPGERLLRQVEPVPRAAAARPATRASPRCAAGSRARGRTPPGGRACGRARAGRDRPRSSPRRRAAPRSRRARRPGSCPLRQRHDPDVEAERRRELHPAQRRLLAGRVGVEAEVDAAREPLQLLQLPLGQRGPHRRDDRLEARPGAARSRPCCPRRRRRAPASRSPSARG